MGTCGDCRWAEFPAAKGLGECLCPKITWGVQDFRGSGAVLTGQNVRMGGDAALMMLTTVEENLTKPELYVGQKFGCVHFEAEARKGGE